ncbi:MAG: hypothetical protein KatS3mg102_1657 [Planctomycetota bacterium]|nr:MAG: hypothetical protein KatS3mg102_1657 [Planctomycetota bacterium]
MRGKLIGMLVLAVAGGTLYLQRAANTGEEQGGGTRLPALTVLEEGERAASAERGQPGGGAAVAEQAGHGEAASRIEPGADTEALARAEAAGQELEVAIELLALWRAGADTPTGRSAAARLVALERAALQRAAAARPRDPAAERAALTVAYLAATDAARRAAHQRRLEELAAAEIFSRRPSADCEIYEVAPGDSLSRIANRFQFPVDGIMAVNGLGRTLIRAGQRLKIPRGPFAVLVLRDDYRLVVLQAGKLLRVYEIGIGREGSTPLGRFVIAEKAKNPTWYAPDGVYPYGHPKNILGTRWLGFEDTELYSGFGIHGTASPESIGRAESSGCIRLRNPEVEELYGLVPTGTPVRILP